MSDRGSCSAGTDTKDPNSESGDWGARCTASWDRSGKNRGPRTGEARGVAGENNVENLSNASSASRSNSARVFTGGGAGVEGLDDDETGIRTGIESMSESDMLGW